jgi:hypothetical protein
MRRSLLEEVGYLSEAYNYLLDHHLWLRIASVAEMKYIPEPQAAARYHPGAKNMAAAQRFGEEAFRILDWAKTQPDMAALIEQHENRILAGAHRFNARYLLDAGRPRDALRAYRQVWRYNPGFALQHAHRILFALLGLIGLGGLRRVIYRKYLVEPAADQDGGGNQNG